ncbi:MAG TPA: HAD family hydrolase, partial [Sphingomonas sp.]|nr:HAD family hydrolase [Sphingomonas sp.]
MTLPDRSFAAFLFDMDGTLVNSMAVVDRVWRAWAASHGIEADPLMSALHGVRAIETIRRFAPAGVDA